MHVFRLGLRWPKTQVEVARPSQHTASTSLKTAPSLGRTKNNNVDVEQNNPSKSRHLPKTPQMLVFCRKQQQSQQPVWREVVICFWRLERFL